MGDSIAVADRDNHCIQVFNKDREIMNTFGGFGNEEGKFNSPMGIATNKYLT